MAQFYLGIFIALTGWLAVDCKEALNITCKMDRNQITVEIFTIRPIYSVQLKNADQSCDPQEFTETSIRFNIQNYQLGRCGFTRADNSPNGIDGTFWNNLSWKEKPNSNKTSITKVKCAHKLSAILNAPPPSLIRIPLVIHLPFGAFPSAFGPGGLGGLMQPSAPSGMNGMGGANPMAGFPPGMPGQGPFGPGLIWLRSGPSSTGLPFIQKRR